jgi:ribosomal protein S18 acetylase RimI-like enzyme
MAVLDRDAIGLRPSKAEDLDFLFHLHREALKEYVERIWGWDETDQRAKFVKGFSPAKQQVVTYQGADVGVLRVEQTSDRLCVALIELLPQFQHRGIGAALMVQVMERAQALSVPVVLEVFKINPARRLYERLGFSVVGETDTHFQMERRL